MGKDHKGKGKPGQKPNNKFKQRTPQNIKQLAKVDAILKGRSPSNNKKSESYNKNQNNKTYNNEGKGKDFSRQKRQFSSDRRGRGRDSSRGNGRDSQSDRRGRGRDSSRGNGRDFSSDKRGRGREGSSDRRGSGRDSSSDRRGRGRDSSRGNGRENSLDRRGSGRDSSSERRGRGRDSSRGSGRDFLSDKRGRGREGSSDRRGNGRDFSTQRKGNNIQKGPNRDWKQRSESKTKQITKQGSSKRQNKRNEDDESQQEIPIIKGNSLFKIIPQNMEGDQSGDLEAEDSQDISEEEEQIEQDQEDLQNEGEQEDDEGEQDNQEQMDQQAEQVNSQEQADQQMQQQPSDNQASSHQADQQNDHQQQQNQQVDQDDDQQENQGEQPNDNEPIDISLVNLKIQQTIQILMNVQKLGRGKPRKHFIEQLKKLIHRYYGYNFQLISHFLDFFNPSEMIQFFEANETHRPLTIRTNTLKTRRKELAQSLIQRGVNLDPLADWSKVGIKIYQTKVPIGATPEYLAGHYMLQSASSLLPVIALDPQVGQKILDLASAPGGKTTYIAQMMKNTGSIFANDLKKQRIRALQFNLYRLGITNTAVTCRDGRKYPLIFPGTFDRVLLDAPCTGLGIISKDHSIKANRLMIDIYKNSHLQKQLLLAAIDCCKVNGVVVYSTCSVSPLENEEVVNYALKRRYIKIVECDIEVGEEGLTKFVEKRYHVDLKKTRRIYPHVHNMDGFYVAKIVKVAKGKKKVQGQQNQEKQESKIMEQPQIEQVQIDQ